ncbi:capsule assembly Wzi family protein [Rhodonellum sp.]|uniref:capsule assembly Wzi family protein n=1 Tax=Rhodonellum sp. TaxID=2231180 RepID=UPI0027293A00|nr:capsule assembly Wzi family protein [Rhodonellum sp.]MDO9551442.1 capsule assembly Wzi family protein [Rhodonellum sp.]
MRLKFSILICFTVFLVPLGLAQTIPAGNPVLEEALRRKQVFGEYDTDVSFLHRPIQLNHLAKKDSVPYWQYFELKNNTLSEKVKPQKKYFNVLPLQNTTVYNANRPYGWGNGALGAGVGFQNMVSGGIEGRFHFLRFQFKPEWITAQNKAYEGFGADFSDNVLFARFRFWNFGDNPERFTEEYNSFLTWGQSNLSLVLGPVDLGVSNENIWWGPGQFNGLIFSNNARGFKHVSLKTNRPVDIFIGNLEAEMIVGRLESSGVGASQNQSLNQRFFLPFTGDWRYLNGLSVSIQPKFLPKFYFGFNRTFQQFSKNKGNSFGDYFPVFEVLQKEKLFVNDNSVDYDGEAQDQQISVFGRYLNPKGKFEIYFEFGKRDHNFNWREFVLNPDHARAYLLGFTKLIPLKGQSEKIIQIRAEITQQHESVNRYVRYADLDFGNTSWHTHYQVRGFTHYGESLGVGIGTGSNIQTVEISLVEKLNKRGIVLERLENQQDFFYRSFAQQGQRKPWIDLSLGFLFDHQWNNFMLSSKVKIINAHNYQWKLDAVGNKEFPVGQNKLSIFAQTHLIYFLSK